MRHGGHSLCSDHQYISAHSPMMSPQEVSSIAKRAAFLSTPSIYFSLSKARRMQHAPQSS